MPGRVVVIDYTLMGAEELERVTDAGVGDVLVEDVPLWRMVEPEEGSFCWGELDDYVERANRAGIQPILRLSGFPGWLDPSLFVSCGRSGCGEADHMLSPWSAEARGLVKERLRRIHTRYRDACACVCPGQPKSELFLWHGEGLASLDAPHTWFCYDPAALESYARFTNSEIPPWDGRPFEEGRTWEDAERMANTLAWMWRSLAEYYTDLYTWCAAMGQPDQWIGVAPWIWAPAPRIVQTGEFQSEEWLESLRRTLAEMGTTLSMIYYSIFYHIDTENQCYPAMVKLYLLHKYDWQNLYIGAEGPQNILRYTPHAKRLGFAGTVVASPFSGWNACGTYPTLTPSQALHNIQEATRLWHEP